MYSLIVGAEKTAGRAFYVEAVDTQPAAVYQHFIVPKQDPNEGIVWWWKILLLIIGIILLIVGFVLYATIKWKLWPILAITGAVLIVIGIGLLIVTYIRKSNNF